MHLSLVAVWKLIFFQKSFFYVRLGGDLATAIETITEDYTIGFGSFVDKEVLPYVSPLSQENCPLRKDCPPPYRY